MPSMRRKMIHLRGGLTFLLYCYLTFPLDMSLTVSTTCREITISGGLGTLLDVRRVEDYDALHAVDRYLNQTAIRKLMSAKPSGDYVSCSSKVGEIMAADAMRSVAHLVPDILKQVPCLFYQVRSVRIPHTLLVLNCHHQRVPS